MDSALRLTSAAAVRAAIARFVLRPLDEPLEFGRISLRPHQVEAVVRLRRALEEFGGGVLCDDVGMGKTFVATAVAHDYSAVLVVAPAALRSMWLDALHRSDVRATITSFERLSRSHSSYGQYDLVIVDEAHNVRNRATHRYHALRDLVRSAKVVLLSATPIHNRETDLIALVELFLGARARLLTENELSRCVIRRNDTSLKQQAGIPRILPTEFVEIGDDPPTVKQLLALPPPLPVRDGGIAGTLIARGLIHQWASSEAAFQSAMRRRRARGYALQTSLVAGTLPTARELAAWTFHENDLQLGFAELLADPIDGSPEMLRCLDAHLRALGQVTATRSGATSLDATRAAAIREICLRHSPSKIIAFTQYEETARAMFRRLMSTTRVALLTARGAEIASGRIKRDDVLQQFSSSEMNDTAHRIDLLLTTDILSEGVNLQGSNVVIHLDTPWTAARLEQRVGRIARIGSAHESVQVYMFRSPLSARTILESEQIVDAKWEAARSAIGVLAPRPFGNASKTDHSVPDQVESLRTVLRSWLLRASSSSVDAEQGVPVAAARSETAGFLALIGSDDDYLLLAADEREIFTDLSSIHTIALGAGATDAPVVSDTLHTALQRIQSWCTSRQTSDLVGIDDSSQLVHRPRLARRIDSIIAGSPFHLRSERIGKAAVARDVVAKTATAAIEGELAKLTTSDLPPDAWLDEIVQLSRPSRQTRAHTVQWRLRVLLLLEPDNTAL